MVAGVSATTGLFGRLAVAGLLLASGLVATASPSTADEPYPMVFPVAGEHSYSDTWGAPRSGGRTHKGTDIFAAKGTPVVAVADGTVVRISIGPRAGRYIVVEHSDGWRSYYLHLDNDTPGTDDGLGGAPASGISVGVRVEAGTVLDFVGDSGNAEETPPHLHFELHPPGAEATNPYPHLRAAGASPDQATALFAAASRQPVAPRYDAVNVEVVGSLPMSEGFAAGLTVHEGFAYVGTWGRPDACPGAGVRVVDMADPTAPELVGAFADADAFPGTSTESVWVGAVDTESFSGDIAAVAVRLCDTSERHRRGDTFRGLAVYDVSDPTEPTLLGELHSVGASQGVHEVDVTTTPSGRVLAALTVLQSDRHTGGARGDVRIVDLTNPRTPTEIADWDLRRDGPSGLVADLVATVGDELELHSHSVTWDESGARLWIANWDAGVTLLDATDPSSPAHVTTFGFDATSEGNAHSLAIDTARGLLIRNDQDLVSANVGNRLEGWGGQRFYDISDPRKATQVGSYLTERSSADERGRFRSDGRYSAHNAQVVDGIEYVSWYGDGMRIVDLSDPTSPTELGSFVPPATFDPQGYWVAPNGSRAGAMVWGVHVDDELIYVTDMNTGLWVVSYAPAQRPLVEITGLIHEGDTDDIDLAGRRAQELPATGETEEAPQARPRRSGHVAE